MSIIEKMEPAINRDRAPGRKVSVLIPCRNEVRYIEKCVKAIYEFDPPDGGFEVIVIDGMSDDGTREALDRLRGTYPALIVIDNPAKTVPHAMNLGVLRARGEYIIRTDVRCVHPKNYLNELIALSERTSADNVGGVLVPVGETYTQKSVAAAYRSPIAMGGALRDRGDFVGETDAVYGGCFRRSRLLEVGLYDEDMVRNQDDELSFRLRKSGGKVVQSGGIKIRYFPRKKYGQLFKQFLQYGYWKVAIMRKHPGQASARHLAPSLLVAGTLGLSLAGIWSRPALWGLVVFTGGYLSAVSLESLRIALKAGIRLWPGVAAAIVTIHAGFGAGFLIGLTGRAFKHHPEWFKTLSR
jgi:glycosyltransferase involved in cell wall biosynthesis